ncbi:DUF397 domain-containing protein [Streptomyces sp. HSW2009]|uniref:DUF397 domain-containing protein n=1 Tax=Streptomyces sp. HSW2009 TaxID=3142890 RepID=UPI0032EB31DA
MDLEQLDWQPAVPEGENPPEYLEVAAGPDGRIYLRESRNRDEVVITTPPKWEAFIKGVKAGEFDGFVE